MPRKKPFSSKQKKQQLQQKRQKKRERGDRFGRSSDEEKEPEIVDQPDASVGASDDEEEKNSPSTKLEVQDDHKKSKHYDPNRFHMDFEKETKEELDRRRRAAKTIPIVPVSELEMEVSMMDVYGEGEILDLPKRPPWTYSTSKEELLAREEAAFAEYLQAIHSKYGVDQLSYFEHNLETWRQLWRVLEMSDMVLLIADIRHPALHFSPSLYNFVVKELKKRLILVLNKVDLVPPQVGVAWRHYFLSQFPHLDVICFTSYPNKDAASLQPQKTKLKLRRGHGKLPSAIGPHELLKLVEKMYHGKIDLDPWRDKLSTATAGSSGEVGEDEEEEEEEEEEEVEEGEGDLVGKQDSQAEEQASVSSEEVVSMIELDRAREGVLTIGMVGHPNVGKSSIINALMARKLVSTSRTPGHTKHFQTLYLTPTLRLCDCPGLVFPSLVDKQLQILSGLYPVAQVREPYTAVGYLARRVPLVHMLQLLHPDNTCTVFKKTSGRRVGDFELDDVTMEGASGASSVTTTNEPEWTAWDICDAWADKRGYYTSRAARPDTYRAANSILRLAVDGRICMYFRPPGFSHNKGHWDRHPEVAELIRLQNLGMEGKNEAGYRSSPGGFPKSSLQDSTDESRDVIPGDSGTMETSHDASANVSTQNKFSLMAELETL